MFVIKLNYADKMSNLIGYKQILKIINFFENLK